MSHWDRWLKSFVKKKCKGILTISNLHLFHFPPHLFLPCIGVYVSSCTHSDHRIILTVRVQIQPIPAVHILLHKPSNHRVIKPCPQIILPTGLVILLSRVEDSVVELFHAVFEHIGIAKAACRCFL